MIEKILKLVFDKTRQEINSTNKYVIGEQVSYVLRNLNKAISAKTFVRHYDKYVLGKTNFNSIASRSSLDSYCIYLGYESYNDFLKEERQKQLKKETEPNATLKKVDYTKEDTHHEWMVYEAALLWYDLIPPDVEKHFDLMDRDVKKKKDELHEAINKGLLEAKLEYHILGQGYTRYVTRNALLKYANLLGEKPKFLFEEER